MSDRGNLAIFFEGTGQGVQGKVTNVTLLHDACDPHDQLLHLEPGPGTSFGYYLRGRCYGRDWQKIFQSARRWFETNYRSYTSPKDDPATRRRRPSPKIFLFGFSRGALLARHFASWLDKLGIEVAYMGLWDTVDATPGLEVSEICPANVRFARHAVAEHESRRFFAYVRLLPSPSPSSHGVAFSQQVEEVLFPGVHSDVGGLYADNHELADAARAWIAQGAVACGLRLKPGVELSDHVNPETAVRHDSLKLISNLWGLLKPLKRIFPKSMRRHNVLGRSTPLARS